MSNVPEVHLQQIGPSGTTQIRVEDDSRGEGDLTQMLLARLEALTAEVALLRDKNTPRSRSSTASTLFVSGATHEKSEAASRALNAVASIALPEGGVWKGSQDNRSVARFLDSVSQRVQASSLGAHAAFFYLVNKCLSSGLAEEVISNCPAMRQSPVEYSDACREASGYLQKAFSITNLPSRYIERIESLEWAKSSGSFDEYRQNFFRMMREADLLDVQMTDDNKHRLFVKGLPERMRVIVEDRLFMESTVTKLIEYFDLWLVGKSENPFASTSRRVMTSVALDPPEEESAQPRRSVPQERWKPQCFQCGELGHMKAQCPKRVPGRPSEVKMAVVEERNSGSKEVKQMDIPWKMASLRLAGAAMDRGSPRMEVVVSDIRGEGRQLSQVALFDTGAQVTCCSRGFADMLYRTEVVKPDDIKHGYNAMLTLADDKTHIKPLGTVTVRIEGVKVDMVVLPAGICSDLIVGFDLLTSSEKLWAMLAQIVSSRRMIGGAPQVATGPLNVMAVVEEPVDTQSREVVADERHCDWPPVNLSWKVGARERLMPNARQARGEAKQLEARMARKSPGLLQAYNEVLNTWIGNGWLEQLKESEVKFCLRHFGVEKDPNGVTPMARCRVVVDGKHLTPMLDVPRCSHTDLVRNLLVWRSADVFTVLDISQAYMRIQLSEQDSYYLCICWGGQFFRFRSLPMGISPSAQILQSVIDNYIDGFLDQRAQGEMDEGVIPYMDDLVHVGWTRENMDVKQKEETVLAMEGRLKDFLEKKRMQISEKKILRPDSAGGTLLGVRFSSERIAASSKLRKLARGELIGMARAPMTRRKALGYLSSFFDPLGLLIEVSMRARILATQLAGLAWDRPLPQQLSLDVCKWIELCQTCLGNDEPRKLSMDTIYVFTDASTVGIAAVALARDEEGCWKRLIAKSRCYKKHQRSWTGTSSKIELLGLLLGVELVQYIVNVCKDIPVDFGIKSIVFGTDSEVNFNRFGSRNFESIEDRWERRNAEIVNNAMAKLKAFVYHVPGDWNPADGPSRGLWKESLDVSMAVNWFNVERAVLPVSYVGPVGDEKNQSVAVTEETVDNGIGICASKRTTRESLETRYETELNGVDGGNGRTRAQWLRSWQDKDEKCTALVERGILEEKDGVWILKYRQEIDGRWVDPVYIPAELVPNALVSCHDEAGHFGGSKTLAKARKVFFWPRMASDIKRHCRECMICQSLKGNREWTTPPQALSVDPIPWLVVGVDITKGFDSNGNHVVLTATCLFTRYVFSFLLVRETSALIIKALRECFLLEGTPRLLVTDNGSPFTSEEFGKFLMEMQVHHKFIPRYAPWYGGFYEITHKCLKQTMAALLIERSARDWKMVLGLATHLYNCRGYDESEGETLSPQEVFRGRRATNVWSYAGEDVEDSLRVSDSTPEDLQESLSRRRELVEQFQETWKQMRYRTAREIERRRKGTVDYKVGDMVYVYVPKLQRGKLDVKWSGPHAVEERLTNTTWKVDGKPEHGFNLKMAHSSGTGREEVEVTPATRKKVIRKRNDEDIYPEQVDSKKRRLRAMLALLPRGELLWI